MNDHEIVGASSDTEAMVKIMRHLDDGYVLTQVNLCRASCPVPVHLHFARAATTDAASSSEFSRGDVIRAKSSPLSGMLVVTGISRDGTHVRSLGRRPCTAVLCHDDDWERVPGSSSNLVELDSQTPITPSPSTGGD